MQRKKDSTEVRSDKDDYGDEDQQIACYKKGPKNHKKSVDSLARTATRADSSDGEKVCNKCCNCGQDKNLKKAAVKALSQGSLSDSLSDELA